MKKEQESQSRIYQLASLNDFNTSFKRHIPHKLAWYKCQNIKFDQKTRSHAIPSQPWGTWDVPSHHTDILPETGKSPK